jgi:hypothetical protein
MKKPTPWYTRGARPERNAEAALFGGTLAFLEALAKGKPRPWLYAMTNATAAASAMNEHRLVARANANARGREYAELTADVLNKLFDMPPRPALPAVESPLLAAMNAASPSGTNNR